MKQRTRALTVLGVLLPVLGSCGVSTPTRASVPALRIYRHSAWSEIPPKGVEADGVRRNLAPGDEVVFRDLTIAVVDTEAAEPDRGNAVDRVKLELGRGGASETRMAEEGEAFGWNGFHVAVVAIYAKRGELGFGSTVLEVATLDSLPKEIAESTRAGGPEHRLRVRHDIDKLTLHHSATPLTRADDLGSKMRNMQIWGENDRNWFDVPYHYIIDLDGSILQARDHRYAGDTNTRYDPAGHFLVNCYGNYNRQEPNEQQLEAIARLMAWAALEFGIESPHVFGHRDLAQTTCPGDRLYAYIENGVLERMVAEAIAAGKPTVEWVDSMPPASDR